VNSGIADSIGMVAAVLTTIAYVPQVVKIYRTKSARDVSFRMFSLLATGVSLWLVYGIMMRSAPLIFANFVTLALSLTVLVLKIKYERARGARAEP
jgi:MtN3 and saliva related transmembrane protein